jgi:queuine/archaeosine tRNA-ribosyltransferase
LGDGILAGAKTMLAIRCALNKTGRYRSVHMLGTGNPLSLLIYSACGADSFDGLDWCQTVADHDGKRLYHSQQLDFFTHQSGYAKDTKLTYSARMLAHNLEFYRSWMAEIQRRRSAGRIRDLLPQFLPEQFCEKLVALLDGRGGEQ